ncbi:predicted protein, partial [Nematostella vectensis]
LQKCIMMLKSVKNDNEMFAALLLVTQLVQSDSISSEQRRELFNAVGFKFINRLLNTTTVPADCPAGMFRSLGMTMLTCFSTDKELLFCQQMVTKIQHLNDAIVKEGEESSIVADAYQILTAYASTAEGCDRLIEGNTVLALCYVIRHNEQFAESAFEVLLRILHYKSHQVWNTFAEPMIEVLNYLSERFKLLQDMTKFEACKKLVSFLHETEEEAFRSAQKMTNQADEWKLDVYRGMKDVLQSKVTPKQRDPVLVLLSLMADLNGGLDLRILESQDAGAFFVFISTLVSIEIRLGIEEIAGLDTAPKSSILISCFNILEHIISKLITSQPQDQSKASTDFGSEVISKVYSQVTEAMASVLKLLECVELEVALQEMPETKRNFLLALARVLCCWLAEESVALQDKVLKVLPILIKLSEETMDLDSPSPQQHQKSAKSVSFNLPEPLNQPARKVEILRFLLPALCHLSAEDKSRHILIAHNITKLLCQFYAVLWHRFSSCHNDAESVTSLTTLTGVLLNFAVTEPEMVKSDVQLRNLQSKITTHVPQLVSSTSHVLLTANLVVLGLMMNHQAHASFGDQTEFYQAAVTFLKECSPILGAGKAGKLHIACQKEWEDMAELWSLGTQVLTASIEQHSAIKDIVKASGWLQ